MAASSFTGRRGFYFYDEQECGTRYRCKPTHRARMFRVLSFGNRTHVIIEENLERLAKCYAPQSRRRKIQFANLVCGTQAGGYWMRRDDQPIESDQDITGYTFHFQISNGGTRQACSVKVQAPSMQDATAFFRQNWPLIESMAREGLAGGSDKSCGIRLVMP